jgi:hypothetical protein
MKTTFSAGTAKHALRLGAFWGVAVAIALCAAVEFLPYANAAEGEPAAPPAPRAPFEFFTPPPNQDFGGIYWIKSYSAKIQPVGGGELPYKPEFAAKYAENQEKLAASWATDAIPDTARSLCTPDGVPRVLGNPYPWEIVQVEGKIWMLYELNKIIRLIHLDKPLPDDMYLLTFPYYSGHSAGRWEGDTLIIQTGGFKDYTYLDNAGAPHSDQLRVTERYRKISPTELEVVVDIHDPGVFTRDWQARFVYDKREDLRIQDWNCGEAHRDISHIPGITVPPAQ